MVEVGQVRGRDLVDLTRSVANLVQNMEENASASTGSRRRETPKAEGAIHDPDHPEHGQIADVEHHQGVQTTSSHGHSLEPGAYVEMLQSLATVGNWGRGRFSSRASRRLSRW